MQITLLSETVSIQLKNPKGWKVWFSFINANNGQEFQSGKSCHPIGGGRDCHLKGQFSQNGNSNIFSPLCHCVMQVFECVSTIRMRRQLSLSMPHSFRSVLAFTVAARGVPYIRANSPKLPPSPILVTHSPFTYTCGERERSLHISVYNTYEYA